MNLAATAPAGNGVRLREYQVRGINEARRQYDEMFDGPKVISWQDGQRVERGEGWRRPERKVVSVVLVIPTGGGKGTVAQHVLSQTVANGKTGIFIAPRREIVEDIARRINHGGVRAGTILSGSPSDPSAPIQVCSIQTLFARKKRLPPANIVFWDEAHHAVADSYLRIRDAYPNARHFGLTATPIRTDATPLGDVFDRMVIAATSAELMRDRHLAPYDLYRPTHSLGQDLAQDPVEAYLALSPGQRAFVFLHSVPAAQECARRFQQRGIGAMCINKDTPDQERDMALWQFREGGVKVITNVNTMTEGVDIPAASTCILARPDNIGAYLQKCGRVLRPHPSKRRATIIDLCGATYNIAEAWELEEGSTVLDEPIPFSLVRKTKQRGEYGERMLREKNCPICQTPAKSWMVLAHFGEGCKKCGFRAAPPPEPQVLNHDLVPQQPTFAQAAE